MEKKPFMTLYEFKVLSEDQQTELVWCEGDFVADRQENDGAMLLYQVYSFYVEINFVSGANKFKIHRSFSTDQLQPYLEDIDITGLLQ